MRVDDVTLADVNAIKRRLTEAGTLHQANRATAIISSMFAFALSLEMRTGDNPAKHVKRHREELGSVT